MNILNKRSISTWTRIIFAFPQAFMLKLEVVRSKMLRYCDRITVKLSKKSTGISTRLPSYRTR